MSASRVSHRRWWMINTLMLAPILIGAGPGVEVRRRSVDVGEVAREVAQFVKRYGEESVFVESFAGPEALKASAGPGIALALSEDLIGRGIKHTQSAALKIRGEFQLVAQQDTGDPAARIKGAVVDATGKALFRFSRDVRDEGALAALFGATAELPPDKGEAARAKILRASIESPKVTIRESRVAAGPGSPYGVEIRVAAGDGWEPRAVKDEAGMAFVAVRRDETYAVELVNDSDEDAAVTLTIDGLNLFAFSNNRNYNYVIISKKSRGLIKGWHRTNVDSDSFKVTEYAKGAAASIGADPSSTGTITARFAAAWPKDGPRPSDERSMIAMRGQADATGRGPSVEAKYREVERKVGVVRASVSVRYSKAD